MPTLATVGVSVVAALGLLAAPSDGLARVTLPRTFASSDAEPKDIVDAALDLDGHLDLATGPAGPVAPTGTRARGA